MARKSQIPQQEGEKWKLQSLLGSLTTSKRAWCILMMTQNLAREPNQIEKQLQREYAGRSEMGIMQKVSTILRMKQVAKHP
jgi:hypothetical protein